MSGIISFRIPAKVAISPSAIRFWDTVHNHGIEVDRLSGYDHAMTVALDDWLATECAVPSLGVSHVSHASNTILLGGGLLDQRTLNVYRTRLIKKQADTPARKIFEAYGIDTSGQFYERNWQGFFLRQADHLPDRNQNLLIVCVEPLRR